MQAIKNKKIQCFYVETIQSKPTKKLARRFIHSKESLGFWCSMRDQSHKERLSNDAVGKEIVVVFTVGYNPKIIELYEKLIIIDFQGKTYKLKDKPDEYDYTHGDIKLFAYEFKDKEIYSGGDIYQDAI